MYQNESAQRRNPTPLLDNLESQTTSNASSTSIPPFVASSVGSYVSLKN